LNGYGNQGNQINYRRTRGLDTYEVDEWQSIENPEIDLTRYHQYARATIKKDRRVNIRISGENLEALQKRAIEEGIPYQTLIASILHKCLNGRLVERS